MNNSGIAKLKGFAANEAKSSNGCKFKLMAEDDELKHETIDPNVAAKEIFPDQEGKIELSWVSGGEEDEDGETVRDEDGKPVSESITIALGAFKRSVHHGSGRITMDCVPASSFSEDEIKFLHNHRGKMIKFSFNPDQRELDFDGADATEDELVGV